MDLTLTIEEITVFAKKSHLLELISGSQLTNSKRCMQMAGEVSNLATSGFLFARSAGWVQANPDTVQILLAEQVLCYSRHLQILPAPTGSIQKKRLRGSILGPEWPSWSRPKSMAVGIAICSSGRRRHMAKTLTKVVQKQLDAYGA